MIEKMERVAERREREKGDGWQNRQKFLEGTRERLAKV